MTDEKSRRIADLNDRFRARCGLPEAWPQDIPGRFLTTRSIAALPPEIQLTISERARAFDAFTEDNDPEGHHDLGRIDIEGYPPMFWKIDYYADAFCHYGSQDPSDPKRCFRVLTIMLVPEY
jgi:Protein of unknown function (DUF3768)